MRNQGKGPAWVGGEAPSLEQQGGEQLRQDAARERLHVRGLEGVHVDRKRAAVELSEERRALLGSRPRGRRWRALDKLDAEVDKARAKLEEAGQHLHEAEASLAQAPDDDARELAAWMQAGERGKRPTPTEPSRRLERDAWRLNVEAAQRVVDEVLERRAAYIEKHRRSMIDDARAAAEQARVRLVEAAERLVPLREELVEAREQIAWIARYPELPETLGNTIDVALGSSKVAKEVFGVHVTVTYAKLVEAVVRDAEVLERRFPRPVEQAIGTAPPETPLDTAMWTTDPAYREWARGELERARALAEFGNIDRISEEARDLRPNPEAG